MNASPVRPFRPRFLWGVGPEAVLEEYFQHPDAGIQYMSQKIMEDEQVENSKLANLEVRLVCSSHYLAPSPAIGPLRFPNRLRTSTPGDLWVSTDLRIFSHRLPQFAVPAVLCRQFAEGV